ncbi:MAG: hypothetical protein JW934_23300 [Anaerolineae bacterium]|nr:hypothetical protein [Anaerolineae bacterium]
MSKLSSLRSFFLAYLLILALWSGLGDQTDRPGQPMEVRADAPIVGASASDPFVLRADNSGVTLEWFAPAWSLRTVEGEDGLLYTAVDAPGWEMGDQAGQPRLPRATALVVVPPDGAVALRVDTFDSQREPLQYPLLPAPRLVPLGDPPYALTPVWASPAPSAATDWVTLEEVGWLRGRRLARLTFQPLRVDPDSLKLESVGRVRLELRFDDASPLARPAVGCASGDDSPLLATLQAAVVNPAQVMPFGRAAEAQIVSQDAAAPPDTEYLIVAHSSLLTATLPLAAHRATVDGLRVFSVTAEAIYDAYSDGAISATAIRDYISATYHSASPPALDYVLLVGDGSEDAQAAQRIPPFMIDDPWGYETGGIAADNRFVCVDGSDQMPDIAIGRLPVNNAAEAAVVVQKILAYEQSPPQWPWNARAIFFASNSLASTAEELRFRYHADTLYSSLPITMTGQRVYFCTTGCTEPYHYTNIDLAATLTREQLDGGSLLTVFSGHSSWHQWAVDPVTFKPMFHVSNVSGLHNGGALPVVIEMTCYTGRFAFWESATLDESLLRHSGGGAAAVWGSTNLGNDSGHEVLAGRFFYYLFDEERTELGDLTTSAKLALFQSGSDLDLLDSFVLLGDPAMRLNMIVVPWTDQVFLPIVLR